MEIILFSANVNQCNIADSVVCMYKFISNLLIFCYISFLQARVAVNSIKRICASSWFVLPVGLCKWKITPAHPMLTCNYV